MLRHYLKPNRVFLQLMCPDLYSRQESLYRLHSVHYLYEFEYWLTFAMQFQLIQFDFFYLSEQTLDTNHQLMDFCIHKIQLSNPVFVRH